MKLETKAITGKESRGNCSEAQCALIDFYYAFNNADMDKMKENWDNSDEVVMDNPLGGIKRGWGEIESVYARIFSGPANIYVEFYDYTIHMGKDIFYAVGRERGWFRLGEKEIALKIRTSRIFRSIEGRWRQTHHHGSIEDPELLDEYQQALVKA